MSAFFLGVLFFYATIALLFAVGGFLASYEGKPWEVWAAVKFGLKWPRFFYVFLKSFAD